MARCEECIHHECCVRFAGARTLICGDKADERCKYFKFAAEVVPKSEVEQLQHKYDLAVAEREANVNGFSVELSKSRAEVERLQAEIETLKDNNEHLAVLLEEAKQAYANYEETTGLKQAKQAYAKEIISEMDNRLHNMAMEYANRGHKAYFAVCVMVHHKVIRPVDKKYAEGD